MSRMAAGLGLEPRYPPPEGGVLPLDDPAILETIYQNQAIFNKDMPTDKEQVRPILYP